VMYPEITGDGKKKEDHSKHSGMDHGQMKMEEDPNRYNANALGDIVTLNYAMLESPQATELPKKAPIRDLKFTLTGNMSRYVWSMDNKILSETDKIPVKKGEVLRITI
ncbi:MAG TPA: copper oxidase, partial [Sphingobacterium sp.]|nr:copper oxidase [Sphingobacterium sp.]